MKISAIICEDRMRVDLGDVQQLADSIALLGVIQPIVLERGTNKLIAGGRRLTAMQKLGWTEIEEGKQFVFRDNLTEEVRLEMELEENVRRKDMTWQERALAIEAIHRQRSRTAALSSSKWLLDHTGNLLGISQGNVSYALLVSKYLREKDPVITQCESMTDALKQIMKWKEEEAARLVAQKIAATRKAQPLVQEQYMELLADPTEPVTDTKQLELPLTKPEIPSTEIISSKLQINLSHMLFNMDALKLMSDVLKPESVDHIVTDPPYAIDMDMLEQQNTGMDVSTVRAEHDVENNIRLLRAFVPLAYRVLRDKGFFIMWYDMDHHEKLASLATEAGFSVQRWPFVWVKTHPCLNQTAQYNFTKATEVAMICRKGNATLQNPQSTNWINLANTEQSVWKHPFAKPSNLWGHLLEAIAYKGQTILDPFAGVGSCPVTALTMDLQIIACEVNEQHYVQLVQKVKNFYTTFVRGNLEFV